MADKSGLPSGSMSIVPLLLLLGCQSTPDALDLPSAPAPIEASAPELQVPESQQSLRSDPERIEADLTFNDQAAARARVLLAETTAGAEERALALYTLGAARAVSDLGRLASAATDGTPAERRAALFGLGLLGDDGFATLMRVRERDARGVEGPLALAFLLAQRAGSAVARATLEDLAHQTGELANAALLCLQEDGGARESDWGPARMHAEMRWRAARRFGLVDGRRWQGLVQERLLADSAFIDRVVLEASRDLDRSVLRVHLGELLEASEPHALALAAGLFPDEWLEGLSAGLWERPSVEAAEIMIAAIDEARSERRARALLEALMRSRPEVSASAGRLVFRAGGDLPWSWFAGRIAEGSPGEQKRLIESCGDRGDRALVGDLAAFVLERRDLPIFGEGVVALVRLGHAEAKPVLDRLLAAGPGPERSAVLGALARVQHDSRMAPSVAKALARDDLEPELRFEFELGRAANGQPGSHARLRQALEDGLGDPVRLVRALAVRPEAEDLALLRRRFPTGESLELDVALALALVRHRDPATTLFLRRALWRPRWNTSLLAGGLLVRVAGLEALLDELDSAPPAAGEGDQRRVGFAIGEWGGLAAVEHLARTHGESHAGLQGAVLGALAQRTAQRRP